MAMEGLGQCIRHVRVAERTCVVAEWALLDDEHGTRDLLGFIEEPDRFGRRSSSGSIGRDRFQAADQIDESAARGVVADAGFCSAPSLD